MSVNLKKIISWIVVIVIATGLMNEFVFVKKIEAAGWMKYVQSGELNAWMSGVRSAGDYVDYDGFLESYADFYKISVPSSGIITIKTNGSNPADEQLSSTPTITVYDQSLNSVYENWFYYANYNSAYDIRYDNIAVSAGTYYIEIYGGSDEYQLYIGYQPTVTKTNITKIKSKKRALVVSWAGCSGIQGYQLQYSMKKSMKGAKMFTVSNSSRTKTIKRLKRKKKYYLRIRTYKVISGKTYYSGWSAKWAKKTK